MLHRLDRLGERWQVLALSQRWGDLAALVTCGHVDVVGAQVKLTRSIVYFKDRLCVVLVERLRTSLLRLVELQMLLCSRLFCLLYKWLLCHLLGLHELRLLDKMILHILILLENLICLLRYLLNRVLKLILCSQDILGLRLSSRLNQKLRLILCWLLNSGRLQIKWLKLQELILLCLRLLKVRLWVVLDRNVGNAWLLLRLCLVLSRLVQNWLDRLWLLNELTLKWSVCWLQLDHALCLRCVLLLEGRVHLLELLLLLFRVCIAVLVHF